MDSAETFGYFFGYRNMKKVATLDPNAKKAKVWALLASFEESLKKIFS